jgi:gliding motility-associated-like protein
MMSPSPLRTLTFVLLCLFSIEGYSQLVTTNVAPNNDPVHLVQNVLVGGGVTTSNISFTGAPVSIGFFDGTNSNIGLDSGIIITSGSIANAPGPNSLGSTTTGNGTPGNPLLTSVSGFTTFDASILQFDFVPLADTLEFKYVFGSEEYPEFVGGSVNDVFGFFLTGPDPNGGNYTDENIALIPGTTTPITINDVNCQNNSPFYICNENSGGPFGNPCAANYVCPTGVTTVEYDGFTTVLTAKAPVICGQTYIIKMAIADAGDPAYDSGVFLEAGSFVSPSLEISPTANLANSPNDTALIEGCGDPYLEIIRNGNINDTLLIPLNTGGTALDGIDYQSLPDTIVMLPGVTQVNLPLVIFYDLLAEGSELLVLYTDPIVTDCFTYDPVQIFLTIQDQPPITWVDTLPDLTFDCPGSSFTVEAEPQGGYGYFKYNWSTGSTDSIISDQINQTTTYWVEVTDTCNTQFITDTFTVFIDYDSLDVTVFDYEVCSGDEVSAAVTINQGKGPFQFDWNNGLSDSIYTFNPQQDTTLLLTITDECGISETYSIPVNVLQDAIADFDYFISGSYTNTFLNFSSGAVGGYEWYIDVLDTLFDVAPIYEFPTFGQYEVTLIAYGEGGCNDTVVELVDVISEYYFFIPNSFTPNGDDKNEYFSPKGQGFDSYTYEIYNRWGERIAFGTEMDEGWDGTVNGVPAPMGVYLYRFVVEKIVPGEPPVIEDGYVTLIR